MGYAAPMRRILAFLSLLLLPACGDLNARIESEALRAVQADVDLRVEAMGLDAGEYRVTTDGLPGPGSHGGNGVALALTPRDGDADILPLGLEYDYRFRLLDGDTRIVIDIVHRPTDAELRAAVERALEAAEDRE